jgi:hypothetical protein
MKKPENTPFSSADFGSVVAELLDPPRLAPLGPGNPNAAVRARLQSLKPADLFAPRRVVDADMAAACLAGLWLYHDFLDESHTLSQSIDTTSGSYWHGLLHRREPDFSNAGYWFRHVGTHPVFEPLRVEATKLAAGASGKATFLRTQTSWAPFAFIELCEASYDEKSPGHELCRQVQRVEWELLFDYCFRRAVGT